MSVLHSKYFRMHCLLSLHYNIHKCSFVLLLRKIRFEAFIFYLVDTSVSNLMMNETLQQWFIIHIVEMESQVLQLNYV